MYERFCTERKAVGCKFMTRKSSIQYVNSENYVFHRQMPIFFKNELRIKLTKEKK